jgi:DNA-binding MarR family transcriptional regulator
MLLADVATGHDIAMALRAAYLTFHRQANAYFARHGVTADQFVLLAALQEQDGVTQQDLVRRISSDPNTVRAMLLLLEEQGFVARAPHPTDGRALSVVLTANGQRTYAKLREGSEPLRGRLLAAFRPDEATAFLELLDRVAKVMGLPQNARGRKQRRYRGAAKT